MKPRYLLESDDLQWVLKREVEADTKGEDGKLTGKKRLRQEVVGYYPRVQQALERLLECRIREVGTVNPDDGEMLGRMSAAAMSAMAEIRAMGRAGA